jgi:hypothetical protein
MKSIGAFARRGARASVLVEWLAYSGGLTLLLLLFSSWVMRDPAAAQPWASCGAFALADLLAVLALGAIALVAAPAVVASSVAAERRAGTLDQLRTTPLVPLELCAGLVVGAPARLYLLGAGPLALHVVAGIVGVVSRDALVASLVTLAVGGVASSLLGLAVALAPRQDSGGALIGVGVAGALGASGLVSAIAAGESDVGRWAFLHPAGALHAAMLAPDGLWRRCFVAEWRLERFERADIGAVLAIAPMLGALLFATVSVLLGRAACRKLAAPQLPLFSKRQALALFSVIAAALVLPLPASVGDRALQAVLGIGLLLLPVAATLGLLATPSSEAWSLALRRGRRLGTWDDDAAPRNLMWLMTLAFFALTTARVEVWPGHGGEALLWCAALALTLPLYLQFAMTRYASPTARAAFLAVIAAHLLVQVIAIGITLFGASSSALPSLARLAVAAVPAWVALRQRALARRVLGAPHAAG